MPRKFNKLWVFGDSNCTPNFLVSPQDSFWGLAATQLGIERIVNVSRPGNSFVSIQHLVVSMQNQYDWQNDLFLIGIPQLERVTFFDQGKKTVYNASELDTSSWLCQQFEVPYHRGLINWSAFGGDRNAVMHESRSWTETETLRNIYLLSQWLRSHSAGYVIINLNKNFDKDNQWGPTEFLLPEMLNDPNCILFEHSYRDCNIDVNYPPDFDLLQWEGHHGAAGNLHFYNVALKPKLEELFC